MNAHFNHNLPMAVLSTCTGLGTSPAAPWWALVPPPCLVKRLLGGQPKTAAAADEMVTRELAGL